MSERPQPPVAEKRPQTLEQLGRARTDDYRWLKDENWQAVLRDPAAIRPDIKAYLDAENAYREAMMAATLPLQKTLFEEMKGRIKEDDSSVPAPDGPWEYYVRFETGDQHPRHCRRPRGGGPEQVLLDANELAKGKAYSEVSAAAHSPDHRLFAYSEDSQGSEVHEIVVRDLKTGEQMGETIGSATGALTFSPCSRYLFWINRDDHGRGDKILRRAVEGGPIAEVYKEPDPGMFLSVGRSADDAFVVIGSGDHETSEARFIPAADPQAAPQVLEPRQTGVQYQADHWGDRWVIRTNADEAIDFKIVTAPTDAPQRANWRDLVPHTPGRFIEAFDLTRDHLARQERTDANTRIVIRERAGQEHAIAVDEPAFALSLIGASEFATTTTRYAYNSPSTPTQTFDYDMASRERTLRKVQEVPSGHDPADYVVERLYATADDGARVPISLLRRKETPVDGSAPVLLYGYGSYGLSMPAGFSTSRLSLVDRGFIYAIAHIRGGADKGWGWFTAARKQTKARTFTDFIACAEHLIQQGYTRPGRIVAMGGSAGGLLMGAVANLRPDLWGAVIGQVPFVDVLNTMSDASLPLTPPEWPEWGNPLEDPAAYDWIAAYSPYDNIRPQPYPPILATGGLSDPRVTYWEPAKWVARLRPASTSGNPILLKMNMEAGHGGASGRFDFLKEIAHDYAFAIWALDQ
ncbi:S9 family peptidase [Brevundimonas sp. 2R-24]|uniref:S9 family peptidase n=1 Tax=Peiella sedimenti TaxID=3061083 RepID=A0ABT8SIJ4_9CAUL|nr:S9 family peptidase [Caulobacteraceae bacterium XZ-24]